MSTHKAPVPLSPIALARHQPDTHIDDNAGLLMLDRSLQARFGCKGEGAANWLQTHTMPLPTKPNSYKCNDDYLVVRLGVHEYLVEGLTNSHREHLAALTKPPWDMPEKVWPVLHQDAAIRLSGMQLHNVLQQVCALNMQNLDTTDCPVFLTNMVGVSVTMCWLEQHLYLWCDGTFGAYLWDTLHDVAKDCGSVALRADLVPANV